MYSLILEIPLIDTSTNRMRGRHWTVAHSKLRAIKNGIINQSLGKRPKEALTSFKLAVVRYSPKYLDLDNFNYSLKGVFDGLVLARVIHDDNWELLNPKNFTPDQVKSKNKKLVITVKEINADIG